MKTYQETIDFIFAQLPYYQKNGAAAYKANLDNSLVLDHHFKHPHESYSSIHVAGTNGKGSISHIIASIFQSNGYNTGLYTSPHLKSFRERIKVNGQCIDEGYVVEFVDSCEEILSKLKPSFFELTVAMALKYFKDTQVDIAIIEVGMGGRLDSTNIIQPILSIISNISYDHTQFLGNSLPAIAYEKAGIIKPNTPVVVGEYHPETAPVFVNKAIESNSSIVFADQVFEIPYLLQTPEERISGTILKNGEPYLDHFECDLQGGYQKKNIQTVACAIDHLKASYPLETAKIKNGLAKTASITGLNGRWQTIHRNPRVICDTAHNPAGIREVLNQISQIPYRHLHLILGFVNDKALSSILVMLPTDATYYFTEAMIPRAMKKEILQSQAKSLGIKGEVYQNVEMAYAHALDHASPEDLIFIGGSTFIVAEIL